MRSGRSTVEGPAWVPGRCQRMMELTRIVDFAAINKRPAISGRREFVGAGASRPMAPTPDLVRRVATYVHRILDGAKPAGLPVERPTKFELVINLKTAKALELTIPQSIRVRADGVIR